MMALHNTRGKEGEEMAAKYLSGHGFEIMVRNWKCSYYEIDVIATKMGILHFIEVKTRHSLTFGFPEEGVSRKKFNNIKKAAAYFVSKYQWKARIQFDILSILCTKGKPAEFLFIEDVYL